MKELGAEFWNAGRTLVLSSFLLTLWFVLASKVWAQHSEAPLTAPFPTDDEDLVSNNALPLPEHPERKPTNPENTLPKASQPGRESRKSILTQARTARNIIPGSPARNLGMPSTIQEAAEDVAVRDSKEEPPAGILGVLPHKFGKNGGIAFECIYTGESFTKAHGGLSDRRRSNYRSNLDLVATADTGKLGLWDRGRLFVYGQNLSGNPISTSTVGDVQLFSNLDSTINDTERPQFTSISEYWYAGWPSLVADFAVSFRM